MYAPLGFHVSKVVKFRVAYYPVKFCVMYTPLGVHVSKVVKIRGCILPSEILLACLLTFARKSRSYKCIDWSVVTGTGILMNTHFNIANG